MPRRSTENIKITDLDDARTAQRITDELHKAEHTTTMGVKFMAIPDTASSSTPLSSVLSGKRVLTSYRLPFAYLSKSKASKDYFASEDSNPEKEYYGIERRANYLSESTMETPRLDSEPTALQHLTKTANPAKDGVNSESFLASMLKENCKKVNELSARLRVKIYMQNSLYPPCKSGGRPGIPCHTYIPQFLTKVKSQYPDVDFRVKVAHYGDYSGVTRYGTDNYKGRIKEKDKNWYK